MSSNHRRSSGVNSAASLIPSKLFNRSSAEPRKTLKPESPSARPSRHSSLVMVNSTRRGVEQGAEDGGELAARLEVFRVQLGDDLLLGGLRGHRGLSGGVFHLQDYRRSPTLKQGP